MYADDTLLYIRPCAVLLLLFYNNLMCKMVCLFHRTILEIVHRNCCEKGQVIG